MQYALKKFGESYEYDENVIHHTVNDSMIINLLLKNYNENVYDEFERDLFKTESHIMFDFLKYTNDIEMNGVLENFDVTQHEMENRK